MEELRDLRLTSQKKQADEVVIDHNQQQSIPQSAEDPVVKDLLNQFEQNRNLNVEQSINKNGTITVDHGIDMNDDDPNGKEQSLGKSIELTKYRNLKNREYEKNWWSDPQSYWKVWAYRKIDINVEKHPN